MSADTPSSAQATSGGPGGKRRADPHRQSGGGEAWIALSFSQPAGLELLDG